MMKQMITMSQLFACLSVCFSFFLFLVFFSVHYSHRCYNHFISFFIFTFFFLSWRKLCWTNEQEGIFSSSSSLASSSCNCICVRWMVHHCWLDCQQHSSNRWVRLFFNFSLIHSFVYSFFSICCYWLWSFLFFSLLLCVFIVHVWR